MAITADVLTTFANLDTAQAVRVLHRVGLETEVADAILGHVRGVYPERGEALMAALAARGEAS